MNFDTIFQFIRYGLIAAGGYIVGKGWANETQWEAVIGLVTIVLPALWGFYVKWNTTPVLDKVIVKENLASVSGATGERIAPPGPPEWKSKE